MPVPPPALGEYPTCRRGTRRAGQGGTEFGTACRDPLGTDHRIWGVPGVEEKIGFSGDVDQQTHGAIVDQHGDVLSRGTWLVAYADRMRPVDEGAAPEVVNLTPHVVRLVGDGVAVELAPAGPPARVVLRPDLADGQVRIGPLVVPLKRTSASPLVTGVPDRRPGVLFIVARAVAEALPDRDDLVYPHDTVRDERGVVVGCRSLARPAVADGG